MLTALASVHCGGSAPSPDDGNAAETGAFTAGTAPDAHLIGTWSLVQTDSHGKDIPIADQQITVGTGVTAETEWKLEYKVLSYTFTKDEGAPDTHGAKRFKGSYVYRQDGTDNEKTEAVSIVYSTDSAAGKVRTKDETSANASIDTYEIKGDTLTLKSSGHTRNFVRSSSK
jgi:hypothetical protein